MTKSKTLLYLCLSFVSGIFLDSLLEVPQLIWLGILVLGVILISLWWPKNKKVVVFGFCLLVLVTGAFRHNLAIFGNPFGNSVSKSMLLETEFPNGFPNAIFQGTVIKEPEIRTNQVKLVVKNEKINKVLITTELYPEYEYGDELEIKGQLKIPIVFDDFNYQEYLAKDAIYSVVYYPEIKLIAKNQGSRIYQAILTFKNQLRQIIEQTLLPPQSVVLGAIFLGDKQRLSEDLKEKLNITGLRHIVAISGMHMVIMTEILLFLALGFGLWRGQAFYFVLIFLFLYVLMIGAPASAVRAGIMAGLLLLAQKVGRLRSADRAVVFAATAMLIINPLLLKFDVGFQLSFMAVLSIVYLKPILDRKTETWPNPLKLKDILMLTLAAQIGVLPLLIFHFGRLSIISPLANLLIVPLLPIIMFSGLALGLVGLIWLALAKILAWPIWLLLTYLIKIIDWLSIFPLAAFELKNVSWIILTSYYLILAIIIWRIRLREQFS